MLRALNIIRPEHLFLLTPEHILHQYQIILFPNILTFDGIEPIDLGQEGFGVLFVIFKELL